MVLHTYSAGCSFTPPMVEAGGIEPPSENLLIQLSPGAGHLYYFPRRTPVNGGDGLVAFLFMTASKANGRCTFTTE